MYVSCKNVSPFSKTADITALSVISVPVILFPFCKIVVAILVVPAKTDTSLWRIFFISSTKRSSESIYPMVIAPIIFPDLSLRGVQGLI